MLLMKPQLFARLNTTEGLQEALQQAIKLEHATIPPYLYAMYSLMPGENTEIANLISSVVSEEMAHMALACNLLNAIGGFPAIDEPGLIPTYPGSLPGTVEHQLEVNLAPFSIGLVEGTFMTIEAPEDPLHFPDGARAEKPLTIGSFYEAIEEQIRTAGESIFNAGHPGCQVYGGIALPEVIPVKDIASASAAIEAIVEQGEGSTSSPLGDAAGDELAHYYRFAEIKEGRKLVSAPELKPPWAYRGEAIPFDPTKVHPVITDPRSERYPAGSPARHACDTFNYTYTSLLKVLHETFNGSPGKLGPAVGLMESLNEQAQTMMTIESGIGGNAGPSFEYRPTNP
jgi:rubrerythrin